MSYTFDKTVLREYDIRGIVGKTLFAETAYHTGRVLSSVISKRKMPLKVVVGGDGRHSTPMLRDALINGFLDSGVEVIDIGTTPSPQVYFADFHFGASASVSITGSHNPPEYNGLKLVVDHKAYYQEDIQKMQEIAQNGDYINGKGTLKKININNEYANKLVESAFKDAPRKLRIGWDPGNGATGDICKLLTQKITSCEHYLINEKIDGNFPSHHPDPTVPKYMQQLIALVLDNNLDIGVAFDGDGDRLGVIDARGRLISGDKILILYAKDLVKRHTNPKVVCDVKTSDLVVREIEKAGAKVMMWRTGHSNIKAKMLKEGALLGGEMSGHFMFDEDYYGFDDALFGACKLINILSHSSEPLAEMIDNIPESYSTPEVRIDLDESIKFQRIEDIKNILRSKNIAFNDMDGVRVKMDKGWWLARASNTQNCIVVRVEGDDKITYQNYIQEVCTIFEAVNINYKPLVEAS